MVYNRIRGKGSDLGIPSAIFFIMKRKLSKILYLQGYGRHTEEEVLQIARADLKALEDFIGNKKFLFGENPCVEDAIVFSWTCQLAFVGQSPLNKLFIAECPNLMRHLQTVKDTYWKDWDACLKK
jgi:glutathione S-transferase